jgi:hypothetical protein
MMLTKLTPALTAGPLLSAQATAQEKKPAPPQKLYAIMLAGLRFVEDGRLAWTASWIAPFEGASLARGT